MTLEVTRIVSTVAVPTVTIQAGGEPTLFDSRNWNQDIAKDPHGEVKMYAQCDGWATYGNDGYILMLYAPILKK